MIIILNGCYQGLILVLCPETVKKSVLMTTWFVVLITGKGGPRKTAGSREKLVREPNVMFSGCFLVPFSSLKTHPTPRLKGRDINSSSPFTRFSQTQKLNGERVWWEKPAHSGQEEDRERRARKGDQISPSETKSVRHLHNSVTFLKLQI